MKLDPNSIANKVIAQIIVVIIIALFTAITQIIAAINYNIPYNYLTILLSLTSLIFIIYFAWFNYKLKSITGINQIDRSIGKGMDPSTALNSCKNNLRFLGIAANKLTMSPNFEETIKRCNRPMKSIKFLLSHPNNSILRFAAKRQNKDQEEYAKKVNNTLDNLWQLKSQKAYNIEIRLYKSNNEKGPPSFRLFFIDDESVLVSYYVFGEGDGLQMPQMQIVKSKKTRDTENFYHAFDHYFNSLWESSEIYNGNT